MDYRERFKVAPGAKVKLKEIDPAFKDRYEHHTDAADESDHLQKRLRELQDLLYAERRRSVLICLQAMDTR
ncbi:MAG TPA: hypothetical protein VJT33_01935 [bacterium]|nr:hypothetical protein [bacterium]